MTSPLFHGRVQLKDPNHTFYCLFEHAVGGEPSRVIFGRILGFSRRFELLAKFDLKQRKMIGNTSMDPELSLIMANMGRVVPGSFVFDPFAGAGRLFCCVH